MTDETRTVLENIRRAINSEKLEGCEVQTWEDIVDVNIPVIPTPSARINAALGVGGFPCGRIIEIFGPESSGKTTLALHAIAAAQKMGKTAAFVDMEHTMSPGYAASLGICMENLIVSQPDTGNDALSLCKILVENGVGIVVLDSVAALVDREELKKGITDANIGLQARMMSQGLRQLNPLLAKSNTCMIFTNQVRDKISFMGGETTGGGRALKFYATVRMRVARMSSAEGNDERQTTKIKIVKNKIGVPFKECEVDIVYGKGIDSTSDTLQFAKEVGVVKQGGPYYTLPILGDLPKDKELKFKGKDEAITFINSTEGYLDLLKLETERKYHDQSGKSGRE